MPLPCPVSVITWFIPMVSPTSRPMMMPYGICMCWLPLPMIQMSCKLCWSFLYLHFFHLAWNNTKVMYYLLIQLAAARALRFFHPGSLLRSFRLHWPISRSQYSVKRSYWNFIFSAVAKYINKVMSMTMLWFCHMYTM